MLNKTTLRFARYAGFATVGVEWLALILYYVLLPEYFGREYPISQYATLEQTKYVFRVCYLFAGIFFWVFTRFHLSQVCLTPSRAFYASIGLFIAMVLTPYDPSSTLSTNVHNGIGIVAGVLFLMSSYHMSIATKDKLVKRVTLFTIVSSFVLLVAFFISHKSSPYVFVLEAGSWFVWQIWVLWISVYTLKTRTTN